MRNGDSGGFFGFGGTFVSFCEKIFDTLMLGFLWIVGCLPLVTVGVSTTALYYAIVKSVKNNNGYAAHEFFRSYKRNLKPGIILWVIFVVLFYILQLNVGILTAKTDGYTGLFFIVLYSALTIFLILMMCYAFPSLSRFDMSVGWILKISIYMTVRYLLTTVALAVTLLCFGALIWRIPLLFFFAPGPLVFVLSEFLERVLKKHEPDVSMDAEE